MFSAPTRSILLCVLLGFVGCKASGYKGPAIPYDSAAALYEQAQLTYVVDASKLQVPISVAQIEGQHVSYQQVPSAIQQGRTLGRVEIEYPHPRGKSGYALARVTIESKFASEGEKPSVASRVPVVGQWIDPPTQVEEVWELDIPRSDLDRVVAQLNQVRYFDRDTKAPGPVSIEAKLDGRALNKSWERVPELDELMVAVRGHGHLVAYQRTPTTSMLAGPPPSSIAAYRAYAAEDARYAQRPQGYLAGGSALPGVAVNPSAPYDASYGTMIASRPPGPNAPRVSQIPNPAPTLR